MRITRFGFVVLVLVGSAILARFVAATHSQAAPPSATTPAIAQTGSLLR